MLRITVLSLFVLSCSCQDVIEVSGQKVANKNLPLRASSGVSTVSQAVPVVGQSVVGGVSQPVGVSQVGVDGIQSVHNNLAYLRDLRQRILGVPSFYGSAINTLGQNVHGFGVSGVSGLSGLSGVSGVNTVNIGPSVLSNIPFEQSYLAVRQPQIAISQPSFAIAHQPAVQQFAVHAQPQIAVHQGSVAVARPQVGLLSANHQTQVHPVNAAITQVARTVEYRPVPFQDQPIVPQEVVVEPSDQPINIHFRSRSSTVRISQEHIPGEPGEVHQTQSQDDASRVQHEVVKPVVQEVREVIQPYRQVTQEINPVVENVHTVVTHGEGQRAQYVAEPIVRQQPQLLSVRPAVQQLAIAQPQIAIAQPQIAVARPSFAVHQGTVAVPRPLSVAVAQPAYAQHVGVAHVQPAVQAYGVQVPHVQSFAVRQPVVSSYAVQPSVGVLGVRSVGVAQPVVGVNRVVAVNQPGAVLRSEVREVRPGQEFRERGSDYIRYAESD